MRSAFLGTKYSAEYMKVHGGGCIINMGSIAGITGGTPVLIMVLLKQESLL